MIPKALLQLPRLLRLRAEPLTGYLAPAELVWEEAARLVETAIEALENELLDLPEAAEESGYTTSHIRRLLGLEAGYKAILPNAGTKKQPRIRRGDLPRKPGHPGRTPAGLAATTPAGAPSRSQVARAVAAGE